MILLNILYIADTYQYFIEKPIDNNFAKTKTYIKRCTRISRSNTFTKLCLYFRKNTFHHSFTFFLNIMYK